MRTWKIWWIALAVKTAILPFLFVSPDEAYYFAWARHLQMSYFDHPPMISWIMALGYPFWKTPFGARLPGVILGHLSFVPWFLILRRLKFSEHQIELWLFLILFNPLVGLGSFIVTPDVPLAFFWSWSILALLMVKDKPDLKNWIFLGLAVGLGFLSKYMMVLFVPAAIIYLYQEKKTNLLKTSGFWLSVFIGLLCFSPVLIWNYQNDFASLGFQTKHGFGESGGFDLAWTLEYIGAQAGLLNPFVVMALVLGIYLGLVKDRLLVTFSLVPLVFFLFTSTRARVEANWPICAYPAVTALACDLFQRNIWSRRLIKFGLGLAVIFAIIATTHSIRPWLPIRRELDRSFTLREWAGDLETLKDFHPLFVRDYQMAAWLSYNRDKNREVFKLGNFNRKDFYDFIPESTPSGFSYGVFKSDELFPPDLMAKFDFKQSKILPTGLVLYEIIPRANP